MGERVSNCHEGYQKWAHEDLVASSDQAMVPINWHVLGTLAQKVPVINLMCICFDGVSSERRNYEASPTNWLLTWTEFHIIVSSLNKSLNSPFFHELKALTWWLVSRLSPWFCNYSTWGTAADLTMPGKVSKPRHKYLLCRRCLRVVLAFQPFTPHKKSKAHYTSLYHADVLKKPPISASVIRVILLCMLIFDSPYGS